MQPSSRLKDRSRRCVIESQNIRLLRIQRYFLYNNAFSGALVQGEMSLSRGKAVFGPSTIKHEKKRCASFAESLLSLALCDP